MRVDYNDYFIHSTPSIKSTLVFNLKKIFQNIFFFSTEIQSATIYLQNLNATIMLVWLKIHTFTYPKHYHVSRLDWPMFFSKLIRHKYSLLDYYDAAMLFWFIIPILFLIQFLVIGNIAVGMKLVLDIN